MSLNQEPRVAAVFMEENKQIQQAICQKYKISTKDLRNAELIIADGIVIKDRHQGFDNVPNCQIPEKVLICTKTLYGYNRVYKNF